MQISGITLESVQVCLPRQSVSVASLCQDLYGDGVTGLIQATGITHKRVVDDGVTTYDLCLRAAQRALAPIDPATIGAVICISFTPDCRLPCMAARMQHDLSLPTDVLAFDVTQACAGYPYGLSLAALWAKQLNKRILLLDGDVQSPFLAPDDKATLPILSDAGSATIVAPGEDVWTFDFLTDGADANVLSQPSNGIIQMDGFTVFRFVAQRVSAFLKSFQETYGKADLFIPHQANVYMVKSLARKLGYTESQTWISGDSVGNPGSASVPVTLAMCFSPVAQGRSALLAGFGAGLCASAAQIVLPSSLMYGVYDY